MAKRKRLRPAQTDFLSGETPERRSIFPEPRQGGGSEGGPIAQVAREAAAAAALEEMSSALSVARSEGRLIQALPLDQVVREYLVRDRIVAADEEMASLKASLAARGQQTPIDVVDLGTGDFGLISGWRRLAALHALYEETGDARFGTVLAVLRKPKEAGDAYTAMVEENEIRVGLSPFERARIVSKSVEQGVFADKTIALRALFGTASRGKRSKIGSFLRIVEALEGSLHFPGAIAERLGLRIAKALDTDPGFEPRLRAALEADPPTSADAEVVHIEAALRAGGPEPQGQAAEATGPVHLSRRGGKLTLSGPAVTPAFEARLRDWLQAEGF